MILINNGLNDKERQVVSKEQLNFSEKEIEQLISDLSNTSNNQQKKADDVFP